MSFWSFLRSALASDMASASKCPVSAIAAVPSDLGSDGAAPNCAGLPQWRGLIRTGEMAKEMWAIIKRINRKLAAKGQILKAKRRMNPHCGDYYILDLSGNVVDTHIDPEELARKLGVLKEGEK